MAIASILNVSQQGLFASQGSLQTISHNISNVNTPGYSRQSAQLVARSGDIHDSAGSGVLIDGVTRNFDRLVERRLELGTGELGRLESRKRLLTMVENVFNEMDGDGLSQRLEKFYNAADDLADNPTNPVGREGLVAEADALSRYVNTMHQSLSELTMPIDQEVDVRLDDINKRLKSIQEIDLTIVSNENSNPALDLKDQRRQMVLELGKLIDIQTLEMPQDGIRVVTSRGQQLLADSVYSATLKRSSSVNENGFAGVEIGGRELANTGEIRGGELGGLLEIRDDVLHGKPNGLLTRLEGIADEIRYQVNRASSQTVNRTLYTSQTGITNLGSDMNIQEMPIKDLATKDFVAYSNKLVASATGGSLSFEQKAKIQKLIADTTANSSFGPDVLTAVHDLLRDATQRDLSPKARADVDGLVVDAVYGNSSEYPVDLKRVKSGTITFVSGPNSDNLSNISKVAITTDMSIRQIKDKINESPAVDAQVVNTSNGQVLQIKAAGGGVYGVLGDETGVLAALGVGVIFGGSGAQDMAVNSGLKNDSRLLGVARLTADDAANPKKVTFDDGNNQGALDLGDLRNKKFSLFGREATLTAHYAEVVGNLGSTVRQNNESLTAQTSAQNFISDLRESISGVSLEQELTDLIRFQRAFQASSRMVGVADELMQTIIKMV